MLSAMAVRVRVPHLQLQHRLLPWRALCSLTKGVWNELNAACPLMAATRTGRSHRRVFPSERDVFSLLPTCGNGRLNYKGSSTLGKCCGWMAASSVAASPHTNKSAPSSGSCSSLGLCWASPGALLVPPSSGHLGRFCFCCGATAAPGAAQKEFCFFLLFQISSGQGMGTCKGTEVSPSLQRSPGSAGTLSQCGLQGSGACKPLGCSCRNGAGPVSWQLGCGMLQARLWWRCGDLAVPLSQMSSWRHSRRWAQPLDMALQPQQTGDGVGVGCELTAGRTQPLGWCVQLRALSCSIGSL